MSAPITIYLRHYPGPGEEVQALLRDMKGCAGQQVLGSVSYPGTQLQIDMENGYEIILRIVKKE